MKNYYEVQDENTSFSRYYYTLDKLLEYGRDRNAGFDNLPKE